MNDQAAQAAQTAPAGQALAVREGALAEFAPDVPTIQALAARFIHTLAYPNAGDLSYKERLSLAVFSLTYNLAPGREIWALPGKGIMIGRAGWVKELNKKGEKEGFTWWPEYQVAREHDLKKFGIDSDKVHVAYICTLRRSDWYGVYIDTLKALQEVGLTWDTGIKEMLGGPPVIVGIGVIKETEKAGLEKGAMTIKERGEKRAFAHAARQIVHFPFVELKEDDRISDGAGDPERPPEDEKTEVVNGAFTEVKDGSSDEDKPAGNDQPPAPVASKPAASTTNGDKKPRPERPWTAEELRSAIQEMVAIKEKTQSGKASGPQVVKLIIGLTEAGLDDKEGKEQRTACGYLVGRKLESRKDLTRPEISALIDYNERTEKKIRQSELSAVIVADARDKGQKDMLEEEEPSEPDMPDVNQGEGLPEEVQQRIADLNAMGDVPKTWGKLHNALMQFVDDYNLKDVGEKILTILKTDKASNAPTIQSWQIAREIVEEMMKEQAKEAVSE